jgi:hypothetical protein
MTGLGKARIDEVKQVVAGMAGVTRADLDSHCRKHRLALTRQKAIRLAYELTGHSYPSLGRNFGGRDHTTCLYADRKIKRLEATDETLHAELNECRARIAHLVSERLAKFMMTHATSSDWSPPPPTAHISKPSTVIASIDQAAWLACAA